VIRAWALAAVVAVAASTAAPAQQAGDAPDAGEIRAALEQLDRLVAETDAEIVRQLDAAVAADAPAERAARERIADQLSDQLDLLEESRARMEALLDGIERGSVE
jgi:hypothetical protein